MVTRSRFRSASDEPTSDEPVFGWPVLDLPASDETSRSGERSAVHPCWGFPEVGPANEPFLRSEISGAYGEGREIGLLSELGRAQ